MAKYKMLNRYNILGREFFLPSGGYMLLRILCNDNLSFLLCSVPFWGFHPVCFLKRLFAIVFVVLTWFYAPKH